MEKALSNVEYISHAPARISGALVTSYEIALRWTNGELRIFGSLCIETDMGRRCVFDLSGRHSIVWRVCETT